MELNNGAKHLVDHMVMLALPFNKPLTEDTLLQEVV